MALSLKQIYNAFGDPLAGKPPAPKPDGSLITDMGWWHANITVIRLPYGPGKVFTCPCHVKIAPHLRAVEISPKGIRIRGDAEIAGALAGSGV